MARTSLIEDMFDTLRKLPWWVGVVMAAVFWIVGLFVTTGMTKDAIQNAIRPLIKFAFNGLAILALVAAVVSAIQSLSRRKLLDRQSGMESLRSLSWREFEQLVGEAYRRQGYDVEETGGGGADGGVDLVLRGHGETVLVQCKQWRERQVGVVKVRELFGVVTAEGASRGILVTSGNFTKDAQSFKVSKPLVLVDGPGLAQLVRDVQPAHPPLAPVQIPPSAVASHACPLCGSHMALRIAKRGANAGSSFYGCTKYPACKGIRPAGLG
ncbi:MAG: restriction endonuclease [Verrucomicrobia bacterium]|nr:restriction endonuclease [Verrucomicrobiota bacterium]MBU4291385.1 restriction endonuclease [Verrucomicrobiota bacterium]MBU4497428.1 restriction endonuclease [Verrucomicrobiota bacterium]MCG2680083.1 restriction endonuclease [Kiritimatiellia bacterium]